MHATCCQFFVFVVMRTLRSAPRVKPLRVEDRPRDLRVLGRGMGVLLPRVTASFLVKDTFGHNDGNLIVFFAQVFGWGGIFFTLGTARIAILASQLHMAVLPPCNCETRIACNM
jgi:hypothetical protein